jgi:DNA-binding transcriptional regulator GbsR (MarR family)
MYAVAEARIEAVGYSSSRPAEYTLSAIEERFVGNWSRVSTAFGMGEELGRVHAVLFLNEDALSVGQVAWLTGLSVSQCAAEIERLHESGVVFAVGHSPVAYEAEKDPWVFFSAVVRHRVSREFAPILAAIRTLGETAAEAHRCGRLSKARMHRIASFSQFVDQIAKMAETFGGSASSRPMMSAARMVARFFG